jgi:hypothetical protein
MPMAGALLGPGTNGKVSRLAGVSGGLRPAAKSKKLRHPTVLSIREAVD